MTIMLHMKDSILLYISSSHFKLGVWFAERSEQERLLNEKLAKKRKNRLKKLSSQQSKGRDELFGRLVKSANPSDIQVSYLTHDLRCLE